LFHVEQSSQAISPMEENTPKQDLVNKLPQKPGVYQFFNSQGEILYIGKAKNLRKRVSSYFVNALPSSFKQEALVKKIADIKYILVGSESDALLLENNLIKEYKPKYNILLKDDKTYPWICIRNERFPRVIQTRTYLTDGSEYFGPYTSGLMVKTLLDLIRQLYKLRTCKLSLGEKAIQNGKFKRCLEFHMGNCKGPCEGLQSSEEYMQAIVQIREILKGNYHQVITHLRQLMELYAKQLMFEEAAVIKQKIEILEKFKGKSTIVNPKINNVDVFSIIDDENFAFVNFLKVVNGAIVQAHNVEIQKVLQEDKRDILGYVIFDLRERFKSDAKEIIVPFQPLVSLPDLITVIPLRGDKRKLLDLSMRNAFSYRSDRMSFRADDKWSQQESMVLSKLQSDLRLKTTPYHIECFDNSNLQGSDPVASCVVFQSTKPLKASYRHYNIKTVRGPDDYASMQEVMGRRYRHLLEQGEELPDLIIVDGGKGQLNAAVKVLKELNIYNKSAIISIAKRLEEIYVPDDPVPLYLDKNSTSLKLIQRIRDEAHRFGITFHQHKRSGNQLKSAWNNIPGIGENTRNRILSTEPDPEKLRSMDQEELKRTIGSRAAKILLNYFKNTEDHP
jgi:excinuclease ABC subunit C